MLTALDVAKCYINIFNDTEEGITNLKLQKMLFYTQGFSYQRFGRPLFKDDFEAWDYGPVVSDVYQEYKMFGREPIRLKSKISLSEEEERLILDVAREVGKYTGSELISKTHRPGTPWDVVHKEDEMHTIIPKDLIKEYFKNSVKALDSFNISDYLNNVPEIDLTKGGTISAKDWEDE